MALPSVIFALVLIWLGRGEVIMDYMMDLMRSSHITSVPPP
jgi:hypothetical protein